MKIKQKNSQEYIEKTLQLYTHSPIKHIFAKSRFLYAPFIDVEQLLPTHGTIVDLGSAEGILGNFLALSQPKRTIIGIEINKQRLNQANKNIPNTSFVYGDLTKTNIPKTDAIIIFQVLHHLPSKAHQIALLEKCKKSLNKNGKIVIVEILIQPSIRYLLTWFTDHFLVAWFFEKQFHIPILFRKTPEWVSALESIGFSTRLVKPNNKVKIFSNIIIECTHRNI